MTIPIPDYTAPYKPLPGVTPFTMRDGETMLRKLDHIAKYITKDLIPWIDESYEKLGDDFETQANALILQVNAAIAEILGESVTIQDPLVATMIQNVGSATYAALLAWADPRYVNTSELYTLADGRYAVYRVWTGSAYPARIAGAVNIFVGNTNPGGAMTATDIWANPDSATMSQIIADINNTSTALNMAVAKAGGGSSFIVDATRFAPVDNRPNLGLSTIYPSANSVQGIPVQMFADTGTTVAGCLFTTPRGWSTAKISLLWVHYSVTPTGAVVFSNRVATFDDGTDLNAGGTSYPLISTAAGTRIVRKTADIEGIALNIEGSSLRVNVARVGNDADDTFVGNAGLIGLKVERTS